MKTLTHPYEFILYGARMSSTLHAEVKLHLEFTTGDQCAADVCISVGGLSIDAMPM